MAGLNYAIVETNSANGNITVGGKFKDILLAGNWQDPNSIVYDEDGLMLLTNSATSTGAPFGQGFTIDLSGLMSTVTGRQQSMCANYRVKSIGISMRNVDDGNDNNRAHFYQGKISWYAPNSHLINTIQAFRAIRSELAQLAISDDGSPMSVFEKYLPSSSFTETKDYRGFRFGYNRGNDVWFPDDELRDLLGISPNNQSESNIFGSDYNNGVSISSMLQVVDDVKYDGPITRPANSLWYRREGLPQRMSFSVGIDNASAQELDADDNRASFQDFLYQAPSGSYLDVCTGLLDITFTHCNATPNLEEAISVADDFDWVITVGVEGWTEW